MEGQVNFGFETDVQFELKKIDSALPSILDLRGDEKQPQDRPSYEL